MTPGKKKKQQGKTGTCQTQSGEIPRGTVSAIRRVKWKWSLAQQHHSMERLE